MKKNLTWIGIIIVLVFGLSMFVGCAEKKAVVKEGASQDQQIAADQAAKDAAAKEAADRYAREQAERDRQAALKAQTQKEQAAKVEPTATADTVKDIYFDFNKSTIRPDAREVLKANADYFLKSNTFIIIEGNCDERGTAEYNMALGQRRAIEAKTYLMNLGVKEHKMKTISYGKERPIDPGHNEQAWAKNRRDHFVVNVK
jgi:peptidoglycan-associated lipoprotein